MRPCRKDLRAARFILLGLLSVAGSALALEPDQQKPKRLYSNGDSITRAFDAQLPFDNLNLSWVNGYHGFWQWLFGLPDINAHNQRISEDFGRRSRKNWVAAQNGARADDFVSQAAGSAGRNVTYSTVMLGGNDVCRDSPADLPPDADVQMHFRDGMERLLGNLPMGATVQVVAIPDIKRLYDIGKDKEALGIVNCPVLWSLTVLGFPCGSMLSPFNSEDDRLYVQERNIGYNEIMRGVVAGEVAYGGPLANSEGKFVSFTDVSFKEPFGEEHISNIDCFHPSWRGQKQLSEIIWNDGPFASP